MTLNLSISDAKLTLPSTAISDDVSIANTFIFNKIVCGQGEVVSFHDGIASVLKSKFLTKVFYASDKTTAYRWFYNLEDALACHGLGQRHDEQTAHWREHEQLHYEVSNAKLIKFRELTHSNTINA